MSYERDDSPGRHSTGDELSPSQLSKAKVARFAPSPPPEDQAALPDFTVVDNTVLNLWLRRAQRKFRNGVAVIKVTNTGKLVRRHFFIGAKPEYIELISTKLFDIAYHLTDVTHIEFGTNSPDFEVYWKTSAERVPKQERSLIIHVSGITLSLVFMTESDRRDAQMLLKVERRATLDRYKAIAAKIESAEAKTHVSVTA
eukprot:Gregarina_sp_Pseudo_9__1951@NODE_2343_length_1032_cov_159_238671_g2158_i0_p1_GENE_NODE_2343_length_1032_cov_159_238671_g2158_i0NODE_2343_length_1032_cov_159_238671_g2158_i0_p1_ORF_typecomplete_len199_score45_09_NODE_2343_length_1032_cov_159_238671_g2158_i0341937